MYNLPIKYLQFIHVCTSITDFLFVVCVCLQACIGGFRRSGYLHSPSALSPSCLELLGWVSPHSPGVARESSRNGEVGKRGEGGKEVVSTEGDTRRVEPVSFPQVCCRTTSSLQFYSSPSCALCLPFSKPSLRQSVQTQYGP